MLFIFLQNDMYVYSDYQNMGGESTYQNIGGNNEEHDIYMNTSAASLKHMNDSRGSQIHLQASPKVTHSSKKINYPETPIPCNTSKALHHQTSEYMDMDSAENMLDYSEIADDAAGNDYDEVPNSASYDSGAINNSR